MDTSETGGGHDDTPDREQRIMSCIGPGLTREEATELVDRRIMLERLRFHMRLQQPKPLTYGDLPDLLGMDLALAKPILRCDAGVNIDGGGLSDG